MKKKNYFKNEKETDESPHKNTNHNGGGAET